MSIEIYSTDTDSGVISVIGRNDAGEHHRLGEIPVGNAPRGSVRFTAEGRGYVSNCGGDTISEIDLINHRENARIKVGPAPRGVGLIPGDQFLLVSNSGDNSISVVDLAGREEVRRVATGRDPRHMAITRDGRSAYVAIWGSHYVARIDTRTLAGDEPECNFRKVREVDRIPLPEGSHPYSVAIHPKKNLLFIANTQSTMLPIVNLKNHRIVKEIDLGSPGARAVTFSPDGTLAFVTVENTSEVVVIDVASSSIAQRFEVGNGPRGIAVDPASMTAYVSAFKRTKLGLSYSFPEEDALSVIDLRQRLQSKESGVGITSVPVAKGSCSVSVLDLATLARHRFVPNTKPDAKKAAKPDAKSAAKPAAKK